MADHHKRSSQRSRKSHKKRATKNSTLRQVTRASRAIPRSSARCFANPECTITAAPSSPTRCSTYQGTAVTRKKAYDVEVDSPNGLVHVVCDVLYNEKVSTSHHDHLHYCLTNQTTTTDINFINNRCDTLTVRASVCSTSALYLWSWRSTRWCVLQLHFSIEHNQDHYDFTRRLLGESPDPSLTGKSSATTSRIPKHARHRSQSGS